MTLPIAEARKNEEVISLADSQVLRWIDELNGNTDSDLRAREVKAEIRRVRKEDNSPANRRTLKRLYAELDDIQFKPDYMCLIIDKEKDYRRACNGFSINGVKYRRLLGTNGGIKNSTIVFVSDRLADELIRRIENGRDMTKELVPAKLEAYKALTCSASIPVSMPNGILVVPDCETKFTDDIIYLDDEAPGDPLMEYRNNVEIKLDNSDGYGLMLPCLAERWSSELNLDYVTSGLNSRMSWTKGMIFTFDFVDFADKVAGSYIVKDAWGNDVDVRNVELVLTTSMLKLWDSYDSIDSYLKNSIENGYTFGITKVCPKELENERATNYQFLQSYELSDDEIDELIAPTVNKIKDVLGGDWRKTVLFLQGCGLREDNLNGVSDGIGKAIMIDRRMMDDPYVKTQVYQAIKNRINEAKVGVLDVHGNYSIICGDPYALCQSMFGLPITGLMKAGEIYNKYWSDCGSENLVCFRAPMSTHENIRAVKVHRSDEASYWYQYMTTCTMMNCWDTITHALNGADEDGDLIMLTDNRVLVECHKKLPTIMCVQRKATKKVVTEEDAIEANIASFGNEIGKITNRVTSMFEVQSRFEKGSREYNELAYRIRCGQLIQQNAIDKAKGIVAKPMPRNWYDRHTVNTIEDIDEREFQRSIVADKKPYFMRYIYPDLMKQYNTYVKNTNRNALREFQMTIDEMMELPAERLSDRQLDFLRYYRVRMPVGMGDCVMNRICKRIEHEFDGAIRRMNSESEFDYTIMKSGSEYTYQQKLAVQKIYDEYMSISKSNAIAGSCTHSSGIDVANSWQVLRHSMYTDMAAVCSNADALCNVLLDVCYKRNSSKKIAWSLAGHQIIENLLNNNGRVISAPVLDPDGDIEYCGNRFTEISVELEEEE